MARVCAREVEVVMVEMAMVVVAWPHHLRLAFARGRWWWRRSFTGSCDIEVK
jgi:hypothetical protein